MAPPRALWDAQPDITTEQELMRTNAFSVTPLAQAALTGPHNARLVPREPLLSRQMGLAWRVVSQLNFLTDPTVSTALLAVQLAPAVLLQMDSVPCALHVIPVTTSFMELLNAILPVPQANLLRILSQRISMNADSVPLPANTVRSLPPTAKPVSWHIAY